VSVGSKWLGGQWSLDELRKFVPSTPFHIADTTADELAAILFTSGSTGIAKGVMYTHGTFATQVRLLHEVYGIQPGEMDLPTFPLFALFGPALGMTAVIPDMDPTRPASVDPKKIIEAIENFGITNMFGSPALINRVGRFGAEHNIKLPTLKRAISAGAPVPAAVIERFTRMLNDGCEVWTPYGATEALPVASIGSREILTETRAWTDRGAGVCVGRPVPDAEVHIIPISDEPIIKWDPSLSLPSGTIGEITVRGPMVTKSYFGRDEATRLAKIHDASGEIYHRMGDVGYRDDRGRLWFCGRKSHRVKTSKGTLFTIPVEAVFNTHPSVFRTALVGYEEAGETYPVLCVEREIDIPNDQTLIAELQQLGQMFPHTKAIQVFLICAKFPVDIRHNAKIFREKLALTAMWELVRRKWTPEPLADIAPVPVYHSSSIDPSI